MTLHHTSLYNSDTNKPSARVLKQELITYVQADNGLKRKRLTRDFVGDSHNESLVEEVLVFRTQPNAKGE